LSICIAIFFVYGHFRLLAFATLLLAPVSLILTGSRSGLIVPSLAFAIVFLLFLTSKMEKAMRKFSFTIMIAAVAITIVAIGTEMFADPAGFATNFSSTEDEAISASGRIMQYAFVVSSIANSPLLGFGMMQDFTRGIDDLNQLDSYYLRLMLEGGLVALALFMGSVLWTFTKVYGVLINSNNVLERRTAGLLLGFLTTFLLYKFFISVPDNNAYLFLFMGAAISLLSKRSEAIEKSDLPEKVLRERGWAR